MGELWNQTSAWLVDTVHKTRFFFYLPNPYETMFPDLKIPRYVSEMFSVFILLAIIENALRLLKGKPILRLNDSIASLSSGIFQDCFRVNVRSIEVICYCFFFDKFRITTLPWDSIFTWLLCLILVDWGFYWAHRIAHEVNFVWAIHQAHHSGEDFTIVTALRQAVLQPFTAWFTYTPLAIIGIPPQIFLVHMQLTELYMVWIHTEVVGSLGPLEYILNCPSHHRVHHGRNRKYVDKNYSGLFIFWDKLFGTYEAEDPNEPVVYGLVKPVESYNIFYLQFHTWITMFERMIETKGWKNKLMIPFKGPGWSPGKPRLGFKEDIPELQHPVEYWNPSIHVLKKIYVVWHFGVVLIFYHELGLRNQEISQITILFAVCSVLISLTCIGFFLEDKPYAFHIELIRCLAFFFAERQLNPVTEMATVAIEYRLALLLTIRLTFLISALICAFCLFCRMSTKWIDYIRLELKHRNID